MNNNNQIPFSFCSNVNRKELIKALQMFPQNYILITINKDKTIELTDDTKYVKIAGC